MFNKKSDDSYFPEASNGGVGGSTKSPTPEVSIDTSTSDSPTGKPSNSIIDEWLTMKGDLESEGDILVKGKIRGNIRCRLLVVDEKAEVSGGMVAEEVIIRGKTEGTIRANRVILADTCNVASEIYHRTFSVEEGARIEGALHFLDTPLQGLSTSEGDADDKTVGLSAVKNGASVSPADRMSGTATASN